MPGADPGEGYANTNSQLFGSGEAADPPIADQQRLRHATSPRRSPTTSAPPHARWPEPSPRDIMGIFPPAALPVLSGLAAGFAVCDHWYSSVPTETFPNRAFACAATSQGHMNDSTASYTVQSIFGLMTAHNLSWKIYGYNDEPLTRKNFPDTTSAPESCFGKFTDFQADAAAGTLAQYSFLEPSWGSAGNSQHPNYDVSLGEQLIQDVDNTVRRGPGWARDAADHITYDEHGGRTTTCTRRRARPRRTPHPANSVLTSPASGSGSRPSWSRPYPGLHGVPAGRVDAAGPYVGSQDDRDPLGPAAADRQGRRRARRG